MVKIAAYIYPGWHSCPERDSKFPPGWSEWDLVFNARPAFEGHLQPKTPLHGPYDDSMPETSKWQIKLAIEYGIDLFIYGFFWSRGKRVFYKPLDSAFLRAGIDFPFAIMWANRMPRGILPVKAARGPVIHPSRYVYTDQHDFLDLIKFAAENYFILPNYFRLGNKPLFSIFDSAFFIRQLGVKGAAQAIKMVKGLMRKMGFEGLHVMALNPAPAFMTEYARAGFDSLSHYVFLPEWKGEYIQDFPILAEKRSSEWPDFQRISRLPYFPSVSPGWDATPRGAAHGKERPKRYPWWPVVTGQSPRGFEDFLKRAVAYASRNGHPIVFIASMNEWSEGHYLEPDTLHGHAWLEAVKSAKHG